MQEAISLAKESGVGAVGARNSSHCGACACFVELAVQEGMVGVALTHTDSIMVPPGMKRIFLGSNPIAFGAAGGGAAADHRHVDHARRLGQGDRRAPGRQAHPARLGRRRAGKPTTDANRSSARPERRPQGLCARADGEVLCAQLMGLPFGRHVTKMYGELDKPRNLGHFMLALDVGRFVEPALVASQVSSFRRKRARKSAFRAVAGAARSGRPERLTAERRPPRSGIPLGSAVLAELNALAARLGVTPSTRDRCLSLRGRVLRPRRDFRHVRRPTGSRRATRRAVSRSGSAGDAHAGSKPGRKWAICGFHSRLSPRLAVGTFSLVPSFADRSRSTACRSARGASLPPGSARCHLP
jgi:ureidoglycolate dehydrogenase (NAD+)